MKTKIAAAISIVGVLGAGSAAAMVNSQVFDSAQTESGASAAVLPPPSTVAVTIPDPTVPPSTLVPVSVPPPSTEPSMPPPAVTTPPATGKLTAFEVGEAGVVTVDAIKGRLVFVSAKASPGWTVVSKPGKASRRSDEVKVIFESATVRVEFEAELEDGEIVPHVESESLVEAPDGGSAPGQQTSSPTPPPPPAGPTDAGDHHDDRDEEDESDDEPEDEEPEDEGHEEPEDEEHEEPEREEDEDDDERDD